jgi:hypothetical protein
VAEKTTVYNVTVVINHAMVTDHAAKVVPDAIRTTVQTLKAKLMMLTGDSAVPVRCRVEAYGGSGGYHEYELELRDMRDADPA